MKRYNKKGFTLIEMMLAIAITMVISGLFLSLIISIRMTYYRTYNDDDCADIAAMYAKALENQILYDMQNGVDDVIEIDADSVLTSTANDFGFEDAISNFNGVANGNQKWDIRMTCYYNESNGEFRYKFYFVDEYVQPGYVHYIYEGCFWIPCYAEYRGFVDYVVTGADVAGSTNGTIEITDAGTLTTTTDDDGNEVTELVPASTEGGYYDNLTTVDNINNGEATPAGSGSVEIPASSSVITLKAVTDAD